MKKLFAILILLAVLLGTGSVRAQDQGQASPDVPAVDIVKESAPFLGTWDAVSCQGNPVGLRFEIKAGTGDDLRPQFTITQVFSPIAKDEVQDVHSVWHTHDFTKINDVTALDGTHTSSTFLGVTNGSILLTLTPITKDTIYGTALLADQPDVDLNVVIGRSTGSLDAFYRKTVGVCSDENKFRKFFGLPALPSDGPKSPAPGVA